MTDSFHRGRNHQSMSTLRRMSTANTLLRAASFPFCKNGFSYALIRLVIFVLCFPGGNWRSVTATRATARPLLEEIDWIGHHQGLKQRFFKAKTSKHAAIPKRLLKQIATRHVGTGHVVTANLIVFSWQRPRLQDYFLGD